MKFFIYVHSEGASERRFHGHTASPPPLLGAPFLGSVQGVSATGLLGSQWPCGAGLFPWPPCGSARGIHSDRFHSIEGIPRMRADNTMPIQSS